MMSTEDIKNKEVINICDGSFLGYVYDIEIDLAEGRIVSIVVSNEEAVLGFLKKNKNEHFIKWGDIKKIGEEVILVEMKKSFQNPLYVVE